MCLTYPYDSFNVSHRSASASGAAAGGKKDLLDSEILRYSYGNLNLSRVIANEAHDKGLYK